jgi:hypothetical protein
MTIWVEIHCDRQTAGSDACGHPSCFGMNGSQPGAMVKTAARVPEALRSLKRVAIASGWSIVDGTWTCPACRVQKQS